MTSTVLVADHSPFMRALVSELLDAAYDVVATAENGVEAVELAREHEPDVVVLDVALPIRDGVDATAEIAAELPGTRVVVCTAEDGAERVAAAREAGAVEYVVKPFQKEGLLGAVEAAARPA